MDKKLIILGLSALILLTLNVCAAQEMDNATNVDDELSISEEPVLEVVNDTEVFEASAVNTQVDVVSKTDFDVVGDYFKVKLSDANKNVLKNTKVTFSVNGKSYAKNTDSSGIASLQIRLNDGSYNIVTKFAGNSNYKASSLTTKITIDNTREVKSGMSNSEIQNIIDNAKENNVILFKGSSYSDVNLVITKCLTLQSNVQTTLKSGSSSPVITIKGSKASLTKVKGFVIEGNGDGIHISDSDYVTVYGNDISVKGNGIVALDTKYLNITKNDIVKNSKSGIALAGTTSTYIFKNKISNNGGDGIAIAKSDKIYIDGNTINSNSGNGIHLTTTLNGKDYGEGPKNVHINKNTINKNGKDGILINKAGNGININSNEIDSNWGNGISIAHIGSNKMQSNVVTSNHGNGIRFFDSYSKPKDQDISYNVIHSNVGREVEAKDTYYQENGNKLQIGDNWYSDYNTLCPKINSNNIRFVVTQTGTNQFQATFLDSNGNIASLLPDRTLTYQTNDGKSISLPISGGVATFTADANVGDIIKATVDYSQRQKTYDADVSSNSKPINGKTPSYTYPVIPNYSLYEDIATGYTGENGNGNGNGNGDGSGNGEGTGGDASKGNGASKQDSRSNGNSTHSQRADPSNSASNPVNDVAQSYETQSTTSQASASEASTGDSSSPGSQSESVVKQIVIDEDEVFKVAGISFIVLLMVLTVGFYYREDIKEMNSKR